MASKALLVILDGWGIGDRSKGDVIYQTPTPYWASLRKYYLLYPSDSAAE